MPSEISPRSAVIISVQLEIPSLLGDHLNFSFSLLLVLLNPYILINAIHELVHALSGLSCQGLPQIMLGEQADLKGPYSHIIKISLNLIEHLLVPVGIHFQGLFLTHCHRQH